VRTHHISNKVALRDVETVTYSESAQLACPTLTPHGENLGHLTSDPQHTRRRLQQTHLLAINPLVVKQRRARHRQPANPPRNRDTPPTVLEH
jgi:hypothetical protein